MPADAAHSADASASASADELRAIELLTRATHGRVATSMRAMPFVAPARHLVDDGRVLLRLHRGLGCHEACDGGVVAYGADNFGSGAADEWSVQLTGTATIVEPTAAQLTAFGPLPRQEDGEPFEAVYLHLEPQFATVHALDHTPAHGTAAVNSGERLIHHTGSSNI